MNALDELIDKYVSGEKPNAVEYLILMSGRCVSDADRDKAAADLAALQAENARLRQIEAERDALREALAKSDPWVQIGINWSCRYCGHVYGLTKTQHTELHKSDCVYLSARLATEPK